MDTLPKLSPAQSLLLRTAARRADGRVIPPDTLRGGGRAKVLTALLQKGWIEPADGGHVLTDAGYAAIGQQRPELPDDVQPVDTIGDLQLLEGIPVRPGTKLAALVITLRRPQGATSLQLTQCHVTLYTRARVPASRKVSSTCVRCVRRCSQRWWADLCNLGGESAANPRQY